VSAFSLAEKCKQTEPRVFTHEINPKSLCYKSVGKQTHDLTIIARDSKTTQSGGDNRNFFSLGAALQVPQNFSFAPL
jgi:hypothetical protein